MPKPPELKLKEGDKALILKRPQRMPAPYRLTNLKAKCRALFLSRDDTPGCTKEACAFRDEFSAFERKDTVVLGVSTDSSKTHAKFVEKYKLPFTLLADEDKQIVEAYGVWGQKSFLGRKYMARIGSRF